MPISHLLEICESYLQKSVAPLANEIDLNSDSLKSALEGLGKLGLLAVQIPEALGGLGVNDPWQSFTELLAKYSGALAFLQIQHRSAANILLESTNSALQSEYLPRMNKGEILIAIGFSQLRHQGKVAVKAVPVDGGYYLDGIVPWLTGWGLFHKFIVGAYLPDGQAIFGLVPFTQTTQNSGGILNFSEPMLLAAMTSTNTVTATFNNWFLSQEEVVTIQPIGWIHQNDQRKVLQSTALTLGCILASINILEITATQKSLSFIDGAVQSFKDEYIRCKQAIRQAQKNTNMKLTDQLELRAWTIELAVRCAHAAVTVSSGAALSQSHAAQRIYREALVFTVTGQTKEVMSATLAKLTCSPPKQKMISYSKVIHLSHIITPNIPQWAGDPPVEFTTIAKLEKDGYYLQQFTIGEHSATHINAPKSFHSTGIGIEEYAADSLILPAIVIDIRQQSAANPDYLLTIADIMNWEQNYGLIPRGSLVLIYTGWQDKWTDQSTFFNQDKLGGLHFPGIENYSTEFLLQERQIAGIGIDTHGIDGGQDLTFISNRLVLAKPRIVLENLTNLDQLPTQEITLAIGVLRLSGGSGSPVGVLAFVP